MKHIGIIPNVRKERAMEAGKRLIAFLEEQGCQPVLEAHAARLLGRPELGVQIPLGTIIECAIVLGGDGTLLSAAKPLAAYGRPILGINVGHLGFLAEVELADMERAVHKLIQGDFTVEERLMLEARVTRGGEDHHWLALNDVVISRGTFARIVTLEAFVGDEWVERFRGDGLIVATPTGSTAYSLAAGGPIVAPTVQALVMTPICPHSLYARSMVLAADAAIRIHVAASGEEVTLTVDGQVSHPLAAGHEVTVSRASEVTRVVKVKERAFFRVLHSRMSRLAPL